MNTGNSQNDVLTALGPLHNDLVKSAQLAITRYVTRNGEDALDLNSRTKAGLIRDYAVSEFDRLTATNPRVKKHTSRNLVVFIIDGKYMLRFKKLNKRLLSSNSRTVQALRFASQQLNLFPNESILMSLNLGYVVNDSYTDLDVYLTCPSGPRSFSWASPLEFDSSKIETDNISNANTQETESRMSPRKTLKEAANDNNGNQ
jgi:hypothetical protein